MSAIELGAPTRRSGWRRTVAGLVVVAVSMTLAGIFAESASAMPSRSNPWAAGARPAQSTTVPTTTVPTTTVPTTTLPTTTLPTTAPSTTGRARSPRRPPSSAPHPSTTPTPSSPAAPAAPSEGETAPDSGLDTTVVLLSVNGGPAPAQGLRAGDLLTYDITVTNRSGVDQSSTLTEPIPANTHAVSQPGWAISDASATRTVQIVAAGSVTVTFAVQVADPLAPNTYSIVDTVSPSTGSCSSCQVTSATSATRSYEVRMTSDVDHAIAGGVVGYRVEVRNTGLIDYTAADPAVVSVDLTGLLDDASVRSVTGHPARAGAALSWALPLAAGAATSVSFTVRVDDPDRGDRVLQPSAVTPDGSGGDCPAGSPARECAPAPVGVASFTVALRADVAKVNPGEQVTYAITARNTGTVDYTSSGPARFSADLSGLVDDATYQGDATGGGTRTGDILSWRLAIRAGETTTVTFSVLVADPDSGDHRLVDSLQTPPNSGGNCPPDPTGAGCSATAVGVQSFTVSKTSSVTSIGPGATVTYTIAVRNTGTVDYTRADPATFSDDLSRVLDDATYNDDATGSPVRAGNVLSWRLALAAATTEQVSYTFTVNTPDRGDHQLLNSVETPPGSAGNCPSGSTDPACAPPAAGSQSYALVIAADRAGAVEGDTVTYTVSVRNTGATAYTVMHPARFTDDLSGVLDDATYNYDATSGAVVAASVLSWNGTLAVGASVIVRYTVTIARPDNGDARLVNSVRSPIAEKSNCTGVAANPVASGSTPCSSLVEVARLRLRTIATPATLNRAGDVVTFTFIVTNTGTIATSAPRVDLVNFDGSGRAPAMSRCADPAAVLAVATSWSCTATYSLTQSDIDAATLNQSAVARATTAFGSAVESNDSVARLAAPPRLTVTMTTVTTDVNGDGLIDTGDRIDWLITVSNSGGSAATGLRVSDGLGGAGRCGDSALAAGAATSCEVATYTITAADLDTTVKNTAVVMGLDIAGVRVSSKQVSVAVAVSRSRPASAGSVLTGSNSTLLLIVIGTFLAAVGLLGLAGLRGGRPVPPAT